MKQKTLLTTTAIIFGVIAVLHAARILNAWPAQIGSVQIPLWASWIAIVVAGYLSYNSYALAK